MEQKLFYGCLIGFGIISLIFPILGKKKNSVELSTFFMSMGYGGYTLSRGEEGVNNPITRDEYLNKSLKIQLIFGVSNIIAALVFMIMNLNIGIAAIIFVVVGITEGFAFWRNIKKYTIKE